MFARPVFRAAQPLSQQARRYATEPSTASASSPGSSPGASPSRGGSNGILYAVGGAALAGAGYWYLSGTPAAKKAEAKIKGAAKPTFTGGDQGFVSLKLSEVENVNHNTKKFRFELPEPDQVSGLEIASALLTKYKGPNDEKAVLRPYTPISDEDEQGYLDLLVKQYPGGPMSTHIHNMAPGQRLDVKGPLPKYPWTENKHNQITLIAGGTGITPMYQLVRAIFKNPNDKTKVTLVFGNITQEDILLKKKFDELENTYPQRFRAFYVLDKPPKEWQGGSGHITKELLKQVLPEPKAENTKIFVCGPPGLVKAISGSKVSPKDQGELDGVLKELGYSKDHVYKF